MKKINKNFIVRPRNLIAGWAAYDNAINNLFTLKHWPKNPSSIYSSHIVTDKLDEIYNLKCAFCNQIPKGSPLQVEHFRPKNGITGELHTGYYWLGYEWTNLLYACGNCNSTKGNNFQLRVGVARIPGPTIIGTSFDLHDCKCFSKILRAEKFMLINPEIDNPDDHLFYLADGRVGFKTNRGEYSIEKFGLNRDELYLNGRKQLLDSIIEKFARRLERYTNRTRSFSEVADDIIDIIKEEILAPIENNGSFDHFRYIVYCNYDKYILPRFGIPAQKCILNFIFQELKRGLIVKLK
jgi:uncharacterized protein (TIGR02646 family)